MRDCLDAKGSALDVMRYRPDIDGMRAIAVLAVIAFHINKLILPGGFVGVDVFFVISGYLISAQIFSSAANQRFSFVEFYFRRVRRIAPAMLIVIATTLAVGEAILLPEDAQALAKSAAWSLASLTNVFFWLFQDTGYFAASSSELPLLHLWSLSVEEQFYLLWPVVAVAIYRLRYGKFMLAMGIAALASVIIGQYGLSVSPAFAYYMLPSRCGELLAGAMVAAVVLRRPQSLPARSALPLALVGLALVFASMCLLSERDKFPGILAVPPTLGAALIIAGGACGRNRVSALLALPLLRGIGAISYSAYLWHWPLLAFYRYGYGEPGAAAGVILFGLTLTLAALTYRYVEQPLRHVSIQRWRLVFANWAGCTAALGAVAVVFAYPHYFPSRAPSAYAASLAAVRALDLPTTRFDYVCQRKVLGAEELTNPHCLLGSGTQPASRVLLMGDSHAAHYLGIIGTFANQEGFRFRNLEVGSCPPVFGDVSSFVDGRRIADCMSSQKVWSSAIDEADILLLGASWSEYQHNSPAFLPTFLKQVRQYAALGKTVVILGKVPVILDYDRLCREKALRYPFKQCEAPSNPLSEDVARVNKELRDFAATVPNVRYFDIEDIVCQNNKCSAYSELKDNLYFDKHHLSMVGSWKIGRKIVDARGVPDVFRVAATSPAVHGRPARNVSD